jgi:Actinobacteria/chloroflexi VLRF1 release factor
VKNPARGGGRWIEVAPGRLVAWVDSFAERHPGATVTRTGDGMTFTAADGATAECYPPFPPLPPSLAAASAPETGTGAVIAAANLIVSHSTAPRTVGVLLVRLGGYAAGVFTGSPPRLAASKVGSRLVHGRSAAGGTSQHRFARRREKQAAEALSAAADNAAKVFTPYREALGAVVLGGDRRSVAALRDDPRLARYFALATDRFIAVPDPRLNVLRDSPRLFLAVRIRLTDPSGHAPC